jgi:magnesium and cobalt exporter, CNNM family
MNVSAIGELVILLALILLNAFFASAEVAIAQMRKARLKQLVEAGSGTARVLERLVENSTRTLTTLQLGATFAQLLAAATAIVVFLPELSAALHRPGLSLTLSQWLGLAVIVLGLAAAIVVLGRLVPQTLALRYAEPLALALARPLDWAAALLSPLVWVLVKLFNIIVKPFGGAARDSLTLITEEEIKTIVDAGEEGGVIEKDEKAMIYSIFEFGDTLVREVMVPRIDVVAVEAATPICDALDVIIQAGHSRVPVYQDTIDNIIGLLYAKDLLAYLRDERADVPLQNVVRPAYFVPEAKKVDELLEELQKQRTHMAIVVDEYGGVAGLVTIEDILEEIVGEIQDEYDAVEEPLVESVSANEYIMNARVNLDDVSQLLDVTLPAESGDTLGGFIYSQLGKVPAAGDKVRFGDLSMEVMSVAARRIGKVRVRREPPASPNPTPQEIRDDERANQ